MEKREKELIDLLKASTEPSSSLGYICRVNVSNEVPAQYQVSIIGVVTDFDYRNGTTYRDTNAPVNVPYGGIARTESNDATQCVRTTITAIAVLQAGYPPTHLVARHDAPSSDHCLVEVPIRLYISSTILESDLKKGIGGLLMLEVKQ